MQAWEQIQKSVDYIEENIGSNFSLEELADLAALSPFYYQRLFKCLVKKPVGEYIRLRRLALCLPRLAESEARILDIALEMGFSSHEHFTRCFKETFNITPEEYRKAPRLLNHMTKPQLVLNYVMVDEGVPLIADGIVLEVNRKSLKEDMVFIGKSIEMKMGGEVGVDSGEDPMDALWDEVHAAKENNPFVEKEGEELGVMYASEKEGYFKYFAGVRAKAPGENGGLENYILKAGEYVVCSFDAQDFPTLVTDALYKANNYMYNMFLPRHSLKTEGFCAELYRSHGPGTTEMELWMKIIQKKE